MHVMRREEKRAGGACICRRLVRVRAFEPEIERDFRQDAGDVAFRHHSLDAAFLTRRQERVEKVVPSYTGAATCPAGI